MTGLVTRISTMFTGTAVGKDSQGNKYFKSRKPRAMPGSMNNERRWVLYNGEVEPTRIPPEWHAWLSHTTDLAPDEDNVVKHAWQKEPTKNMTGTNQAYRPSDTTRNAAKPDEYQAWSPED